MGLPSLRIPPFWLCRLTWTRWDPVLSQGSLS